jgi:hypothetical protein
MTPESYEWCWSSKELGKQTPNPQSFDRVRALLDDFCTGHLLREGADIRKLSPPLVNKGFAWELKAKPEKFTVRLFGWFVSPSVFLCPLCKYKKDVSASCREEIAMLRTFISTTSLCDSNIARGTDVRQLL